MSDKQRDIIVVGGGLAGLLAVIRACELGGHVKLFSLVPCKRSHSVCAQGGVNAAANTMGEDDHPDLHTFDTLKSGEFINDQILVQEMTAAAPGLIYLFDRMGVPFSRTPEGNLAFRRFGGTLHHRTAHAGASTGQQLLYALDEQVRRYEAEGKVHRYEFWDMIEIVKDDDGTCRGIIAQNLKTMEMVPFPGDAVILATGGYGLVFGKSTCSQVVTGSASAVAYRAGAHMCNPEFVQVHPTAIPGEDKLRLMSESARGEGGRVWVPKKPNDPRPGKQIPEEERFYFLEEKYPRYGNLVPRDVATREIFQRYLEGLGVFGKPQAYLDLSHLDAAYTRKKLGAILEIYEKFVGENPTEVPMRIFPGVHYTMGGLWASYKANSLKRLDWDAPVNQMTNIPGLYACGEADWQYHGANRLGANSLLSCPFGGKVAAQAALAYQKGLKTHAEDVSKALFDKALTRCKQLEDNIKSNRGGENPYKLHQELGELMTKNCTVIRDNKSLGETVTKLDDIQRRVENCEIPDAGAYANHGVTFTRWLRGMVDLAKACAHSALKRDEFRGAHYKPEFELKQPAGLVPKEYWVWLDINRPAEYKDNYHDWFDKVDQSQRKRWLFHADYDEFKAKVQKQGFKPEIEEYFKKLTAHNKKWNKPTIAAYKNGNPEISYSEVKMELMPPMPRKYD
ncbi:MAG: succinate dehydrogenase (quinone) flavoprotein subunit [Planctomycetes bacterium]|nr:succinate dehydrogenase (quinone) flavoprotein subunit [Planctomycetota bacterium]NUQ34278.1 succinate dehydrogenase (quinone) flavoprotein subunit [Planctomycetaceae bacterium]